MEYLAVYFMFGFVSYIGLAIYEVWKLWPIERKTIAKHMTLIKRAVLIIVFWPWLVPFVIYEELK